jgi:hypothetical protein
MADTNTLCTSAQILLAIGKNASAEQILEANTNIWGAMAESDMENTFGDNIGLVANYGSITAANKQWIAGIAADRAAWRGINQNQNTWALATTQSKLNVLNATWKGFLSDLKDRKADIVADLNL